MGKNLVYTLLLILTIFSQGLAKNATSTLALSDSIIVTSPNGGEVWKAGTTDTITWTDNLSTDVKIELFKNGSLRSLITVSTPNDSSFEWNIPTNLTIASDYQIRIEDLSDPGNFDISDGYFTIASPDIEVLSPNGGEIWQAGETHTITWADDLVEPVKIELYKNDFSYILITASTPSDGSFDWSIPYPEGGGSDYKIKITSTQFTTKFDFSDSNFTIIPNEIKVTSPTSSDNWHAGTSHTITWTSNFSENVNINLYKGGTLHKLISPNTVNDSSFQYTVAFDEIAGSDYQIKIASLINGAVQDFSDFFTITANQITITSPNGGELWDRDSVQTITWTDNIAGDVKIELFTEDNLNDKTPIAIVNRTESDGRYDWTIGPEIEPSTEYRIKITMLADEDIFDFSDTSFQFISELQLTSPNGGETWLMNTDETIRYVKNFSTNVKIELYKGGVFLLLIDPNDGGDSFTWTDIPDTLTPDNDYKIKVTSLNDPNSFDFSDNDFSIVNGIINITSPNGGEYWLIGDRYTVTWQSNFIGNFRIELYKSGSFVDFIDDSHNAKTRSWTIPETIESGTDYKVLVTSLVDTTVSDFSDSSFTIALPQIEVQTPNGGDEWRIGTTYTILWTDIINENVSIELYRADTSYYVITQSTASDGNYDWRIPNEIDSSHDYKIMVRSIANLNVVDFSNRPFSILAVPGNFTLSQNYPNPFNPTTVIRYGIPEDGPVLIEIFDITGQRVLKLVDETMQPRGFYEVSFNRGVLPSGVYIYRIISGNFMEIKKMVLTK